MILQFFEKKKRIDDEELEEDYLMFDTVSDLNDYVNEERNRIMKAKWKSKVYSIYIITKNHTYFELIFFK